MQITLFVLLGLVAVTMAGHRCGNLQRLKVKSQWAKAYGVGNARIDFGTAVWKAFFSLEGESKKLFTRLNPDDIYSPQFQGHIVRVLGGLDMIISLLDEPETLNAQLAHLNGQHKERGIPANYFDTFGKALLAVVPASLGRCFDRPAWESCFNLLADGIKKI